MGIEIRGLREDEFEVHDRLVCEAYREFMSEREFLEETGWWLQNIEKDPYYRPEQTRVLLADGEMVASVSNYRRETYCAGRRALIGAIGSVATHPNHRRRGYVKQLLADSVEWMRRQSFDFSFLFGREEVYGGSGWRMFSAFNLVASVRPVQDDCGLTLRSARFPEDIPALSAIHDEFNAPLTGPFLRSEAYWRTRVARGYFRDNTRSFHLFEDDGRPVAYCRAEDPETITELGWLRSEPSLPSRTIGALLSHRRDAEQVRLGFHTHELIAALDPYLWAPTQAAHGQRATVLRLVEVNRGMWRYIGPGAGNFGQVTDTESMLRFLRSNEYVFWGPVDNF